jgi:hypothetical protein
MTKDQIREVVDADNGPGFSSNLNLNGYVFTKNGSFMVFEFKNIDDVKVCHIKYIHYSNERDLTTILVHCCNFWMGNHVQFIFYKEKDGREKSAVQYLKNLNFREEILRDHKWKWRFKCLKCQSEKCLCLVHSMYK